MVDVAELHLAHADHFVFIVSACRRVHALAMAVARYDTLV